MSSADLFALREYCDLVNRMPRTGTRFIKRNNLLIAEIQLVLDRRVNDLLPA